MTTAQRRILIFLSIAHIACGFARTSLADDVTFNKQIAPLVWNHCGGCHRPGEVAPFSLLDYDDAAKRSEHLAEITARRAMPPWKPVEGCGDFANARRLTEAEIALFRKWADAGAPEGAAADLPPRPEFADGWQLGEPDLVVQVPEPIAIPADGRDVYLNVVLPLAVPTGKYIKAAEFRPGNRRVVHHAVLFIDTSGKSRERDEKSPGIGFHAVTPPGHFLPGSLAIWTPGRNAQPLPDGLSMPWPADAALVLNLHLHPTGKPETDQSSIGFHFTDEPPRRSLLDIMLIDKQIDIAPGDAAFRTKDEWTAPIDLDAVNIFPHMHMIGKQIRVTAELPDGEKKSLLEIDDWDFNWQDLYQYAEPVRLPKGTRLTMEGLHDNSADNPQNPADPPRRVTWGEQTFNEMSLAFISFLPAHEEDLVLAAAGGGHRLRMGIRSQAPATATKPGSAGGGDAASRVVAALRKADADGDKRLSGDEIYAALNKQRSEVEIRKIIERFDADGDEHLNLAEALAAIAALHVNP